MPESILNRNTNIEDCNLNIQITEGLHSLTEQ